MGKGLFKIGEEVQIIPLNVNGIVIGIEGEKLYKVSYKELSLVLREKDLRKGDCLKEANKKKSSYAKPKPHTFKEKKEVIDLHGLSVDEALEKTELALSRAILEEKSLLVIIHGHGRGILKDAVHNYLRNSSLVKRFVVNPKNSGETLCYI